MVEQDNKPSAQRIAGRYEVLGRIGSGPHGPTYRARDHRLIDATESERLVALKILRAQTADAPDFDTRLELLADGLGDLQNEVLVAPRDAGRTELGLPYLSYDLVSGTSLEDRLATAGPLSLNEARDLVCTLSFALQAAHERGIVHGALDAHHVFLQEDLSEVRVLDTGLSGLIAAENPPTESDDVQALARVLSAALTGDATGKTLPEDQHARGIVEWALDPSGYQEISAIAAALSIEPGLEDEEEFVLEDLEDLVQTEVAPDEWHGTLVRPGPSRKPLLFTMLLVTGIAAISAWFVSGNVTSAAERGAVEREREASSLLSQELEAKSRHTEQLLRELETLETELKERSEESSKVGGERNELSLRIAELTNTLAEAQEETQTLRTAADEAERIRLVAEQEAALERERRVALKAERDKAQLALAEIERQREKEGDELQVFATGLATRMGESGPNGTLAYLKTPLGENTVPEQLSQDPIFDAWQRADELLDQSEKAPLSEVGMLVDQSREALEEARSLKTGFVTELRHHLGSDTDLEGALDEALKQLESKAEERIATRDASREWEWGKLLGSPFEGKPSESLAIAATYPEDRSDQLLKSVSSELVGLYAPEGFVNLEALQDGPDLSPWMEAMLEQPELIELPEAATLKSFAWAQAWFGDRNLRDVLARWPGPPTEGTGLPETYELTLGLLSLDGEYPGEVGRRSLYRSQTINGKASWQIETVLADDQVPQGALRSWLVEQRFYDSDGRYRSVRTLQMVQRSRDLIEESIRPQILFGGGLDTARTVLWQPSDSMPPFRLPISPDEIEAFRRRSGGEATRTIEIRDGEVTTCWSPAFGLVKHEDPGYVTRELVFIDP